jgi:hypothetical protein
MECLEPDADGDGRAAIACGGDDCDDTDPTRSPGLTEVCDRDGKDEDCDPTTIGERDADRDGFIDTACFNGSLAGTDCDDFNSGVNTGVPEVCNGIDDDCDGTVDEGLALVLYPDGDLDGFGRAGSTGAMACPRPGLSPNAGDCDDSNPYLMPGGLVCIPGLQGVEVRVCRGDGTWMMTTCPQGRRCISQPYGLGVCIP